MPKKEVIRAKLGCMPYAVDRSFRKWVIPPKKQKFARKFLRHSCPKIKLRRYIASYTRTADPIRTTTDSDLPFPFNAKEVSEAPRTVPARH